MNIGLEASHRWITLALLSNASRVRAHSRMTDRDAWAAKQKCPIRSVME